MHTHLSVLIEISMEIGMLNFWSVIICLIVQQCVKLTLVSYSLQIQNKFIIVFWCTTPQTSRPWTWKGMQFSRWKLNSWKKGGNFLVTMRFFCKRAKILGRTSYHKENNCKISYVPDLKVHQISSYITGFGDI